MPAAQSAPIFWHHLDHLVAESDVRIDRPRGTAHPRYPDYIYPLDYGYLDGSTSMDGGGIDVWVGSLAERRVGGVICNGGPGQARFGDQAAAGCTPEEMQIALQTHQTGPQPGCSSYARRGCEFNGVSSGCRGKAAGLGFGGEHRVNHTEERFKTPDGVQLYAQAWAPEGQPRAVIFLIHGLAEHSGRYAHVAAYLAERGYACTPSTCAGTATAKGCAGTSTAWTSSLATCTSISRR
jgi:inorganic pyrophosphatase